MRASEFLKPKTIIIILCAYTWIRDERLMYIGVIGLVWNFCRKCRYEVLHHIIIVSKTVDHVNIVIGLIVEPGCFILDIMLKRVWRNYCNFLFLVLRENIYCNSVQLSYYIRLKKLNIINRKKKEAWSNGYRSAAVLRCRVNHYYTILLYYIIIYRSVK